jgi:hypothetical protein
MRMLLKARIQTEQGNRAIQTGSMEKTLLSVLEELQPEAAYFLADEGERCALIFFDMQDASELPRVCEPFFLEYDAKVTIQPAMNVDDVREGLAVFSGTG